MYPTLAAGQFFKLRYHGDLLFKTNYKEADLHRQLIFVALLNGIH